MKLSRAPEDTTIVERVSNTDGNSTALTNFGATASQRNYLDAIIPYNDSATAGFVDIRDGTGGAIIMTVPLPAKGGTPIVFPYSIQQPTANTALAFDVSAALTTVYMTFIGHKGP